MEKESLKVDEWLSVAAMQELVDTCIEAFKENQRYRELGRIEFLSDMKSHYVEALSNLRQYQKIGTVEECREARENRWISCSERLPEEPEKIPAYIIPHEAWYKNSVAGNPCICVGFYREGGGTEGEFEISWDKVGIRLQAYSDSWEVLRKMPELIELMGRIDREKLEPTITEFAEMLNNIGFKDITER